MPSIEIKHNVCESVYSFRPKVFLRGDSCKKCSGNKQRKTRKQFVKEVYDLTSERYYNTFHKIDELVHKVSKDGFKKVRELEIVEID